MSERSRKKLLRMGAAAMGIAALVFVIGLATDTRTPAYKGLGLDRWFQLLASQSEGERQSAAEAINALGRDCLPFLLSQVEASKPRLRDRAEAWVRQNVLRQIPIGTDCGLMAASEAALRDRRLQKAFEILGDRAAPSCPRLRRLLSDPLCTYEAAVSLVGIGELGLKELEDAFQNENADVRKLVVSALESAKVSQSKVTEMLLRALKDTDGLVRHYAAHALGQVAFAPERTVPALTAALEDTDPRVRYMAVYSLGRFGTAAASALPAIHKMENDTVENVRKCAAEVGQSLESMAKATYNGQ